MAENIGIESIRYPGGSLTEHYFDLNNPDNSKVIDINSGQSLDFLPYSEFMNYAEDTGKSVTIVLLRQNISQIRLMSTATVLRKWTRTPYVDSCGIRSTASM